MKFIVSLSIILFFGSCRPENQNSSLSSGENISDSLIITKNHAPIKHIQVFGFLGSRQILLYEDSLNNASRFSLAISEFEFPAIYRVALDDEIFDVIYNSESISIELTNKPGFDGITFISSNENQRFYEFLKDYAYIQTADQSEICGKVELLKKKYLQTNENQFADLMLEFLLNSTYNCSKLPAIDFIERLELNPSLLRTPYISGQLETIVNSYAGHSLKSDELLKLLIRKGGNEVEFNHFIRSVFWDLGIQNKDVGLISKLFEFDYADSSAIIERINTANNLEIGDRLDFEELGIQHTKDSLMQFILFHNPQNPKGNSLVNAIATFKKNKNINLNVIDVSNLSTSIRKKYTLITTPILFQASSGGYLINRNFGEKGISFLNPE